MLRAPVSNDDNIISFRCKTHILTKHTSIMDIRFKTPFGEIGIVHYTKFHRDLYEKVLHLGNTFIAGFYKIDPDMGEVSVPVDEIDELFIDWNGDKTSILVTHKGRLCKAKFQHNFADIYVKIEV